MPTHTSSNGSTAVATNSHDAAMLDTLGWQRVEPPRGTDARTMAQAHGSVPVAAGGAGR